MIKDRDGRKHETNTVYDQARSKNERLKLTSRQIEG